MGWIHDEKRRKDRPRRGSCVQKCAFRCREPHWLGEGKGTAGWAGACAVGAMCRVGQAARTVLAASVHVCLGLRVEICQYCWLCGCEREDRGAGSLSAIVGGQWVVQRAVDATEPSCGVDIVEERTESVDRVQESGEFASGVAQGTEVDCTVKGICGAGKEVMGDCRACWVEHFTDPAKVCL